MTTNAATNALLYSPTGDGRKQNLITEKAARVYNINFGRNIEPSHEVFYINLSDKTITLGAVKIMAKYFESTIAPAVKIVNLCNLSIQGARRNDTMRAFALIAKALCASKVLQVLDLSNNNLGSQGIQNLQDLLMKKTLQRVDVSNAHLGVQDAKFLFELLRPRIMTHFSMSNNPSATGDNAQLVASFVQKCTSVRNLELSSIYPGRAGTLAITKAIRILAEEQAPLEWVNLSRFDFSVTENLDELKAALGHEDLQSLRHVNVMNSGIPPAEQEEFSDLLYCSNADLDRKSILLGNDTDGDVEEQESQFVELSMLG